jgi:hypothetical protein
MDHKLRYYDLGSEALGWMRHAFAQGKSLSAELAKRPDIESGSIRTYLPEGMEPAALTQFAVSKRLPWRIRTNLIADCTGFLATQEQGVLLVEDALARSSDLGIPTVTSPLIFCSDEVYFYSTAGSPEAQTARACSTVFVAYPPTVGSQSTVPECKATPRSIEPFKSDSRRNRRQGTGNLRWRLRWRRLPHVASALGACPVVVPRQPIVLESTRHD